jgi:hypothetical protein
VNGVGVEIAPGDARLLPNRVVKGPQDVFCGVKPNEADVGVVKIQDDVHSKRPIDRAETDTDGLM